MSEKNDMQERILQYLEENSAKKNTLKSLMEKLNISSEEETQFYQAIDRMEKDYEVIRSAGGIYRTRKQAGCYEGTISIAKSTGVGYLDFEDGTSLKIQPEDLNGAMSGDKVLARTKGSYGNGTVLKVLSHAHNMLLGTYSKATGRMKLTLDDEKLQDLPLKVLTDKDFTPLEGMKVLCDIEKYSGPLTVRVKECVGYVDDPGMDILSALLEREIIPDFPEEVMEQVKTIPQEVSDEEKKGRVDLSGDVTITIDGDDSKDFDDAVSCVKEEGGWLLKVSIADVSHYVTEKSPLDLEAYKRGCSTYVVDRVVGMLPRELSNGICSLNPDVDRLTLTAEMHIKSDGTLGKYKFYESFIHSTNRMTYKNVNLILKKDEEKCREYAHLLEMIGNLTECADAIRKERVRKGAIDFASDEAYIKVDEEGHPLEITLRDRGHAECVIEDCMIAANVAAADYLQKNHVPGVYRVHGEPAANRLKDYTRISECLGHKFKVKGTVTPKQIQEYMDSVKDTNQYTVLSMLMLRCMQKAKYSASCEGHFGLAEEKYLHFTSPIRRYPDLMVHRMMRKYLFEGASDQSKDEDLEKCTDAAEQSSLRERISQDAEYDVDDMKKAEYMEGHVGEMFEGLISSVQSYGFYVTLPNTVEGLVSVKDLGDDYYVYDGEQMRLLGQRNGRVYQPGMEIQVVCTGADRKMRSVNFAPVKVRGADFRSEKSQKKGVRTRKTNSRSSFSGRKSTGRNGVKSRGRKKQR